MGAFPRYDTELEICVEDTPRDYTRALRLLSRCTTNTFTIFVYVRK